jgi:RNA-directed DNA polymerase
LLRAIGPVPGRELIKQWLKAGYVEQEVLHATERGTPQGGVVSPLLANIALHGMEEALSVKYSKQGQLISRRAVVRYADDFVVFCETRADAEHAQALLGEWLSERGLAFSPEKTRIVHLSEGFNFLGFNIRHYPMPQTTRTGWKLLTKPSKEAVQEHRDHLKEAWTALKGQNVPAILRKLNPMIRGWANYHRTGTAKETFRTLDHWMYQRAKRFVKRSHPTKSKEWRHTKYWGKLNLDRNDHWVFGDKHTGAHLLKFSWFPIERHTLVKGRASPDDPALKDYWKERNGAKAKDLTPSKQKLARRQQGRCPSCRESLFNEEELQVHHRQPKKQGGKDTYSNLQLVHLFCHQQIHARAGTNEPEQGCLQDNEQPGLETGGSGTDEKAGKRASNP